MLPAGHAADRCSRKHLLIRAQALMAIASLGLAILSFRRGPIPLVYLCLLLEGTGRAASMPARRAWWPQLVPVAAFPNAVTLEYQRLAGRGSHRPGVGGVVIAATHAAAWAYVLNVICSLVVIGLYASISTRDARPVTEPISLDSLLAGLRFVFRTELILATITLDLLRRLARRRDRIAADLRPRHSAHRTGRPRLATRSTFDRCERYGCLAHPPRTHSQGRAGDASGSRRIRRRNDRLRPLAQSRPFVCDVALDQGDRQCQRCGPLDARAGAYP